MSRDAYRGPKLPRSLLDQFQNGTGSGGRKNNISRKDRRKEERQQKKTPRTRPNGVRDDRRRQYDDYDLVAPSRLPVAASKEAVVPPKPPTSILKKRPQPPSPSGSESEGVADEPEPPKPSRAVRDRLEEDDDEIAALEKKLGVKGKKSKALQEDGLDWLAGGSDSEDEGRGTKRKRPEDAKWLKDKRLKAAPKDIKRRDGHKAAIMLSYNDSDDGDMESADEDDEAAVENPFSDDELDKDDFEGFDSDITPNKSPEIPPKRRQREDPYVPPIARDQAGATKYVPPSLRRPAESDDEALKLLRRQTQGLLNRLSESNMLSILQSLEEVYVKNARQHVTSTLIELLVGLISDSAILNDTFLLLHAGFSTAVYKVIGTDFGAQLLEKLVEDFNHYRTRQTDGKQTLNLLGFLSCLYTFQLVGSNLMFDYIRLLLDDITEANTKLLLRIIRTSGQQLRSDDPSSLKDIVQLLQRSVAKMGDEGQLSVRTKFMIDTINDLKNNRMKATASVSSSLATEHTVRMKKMLGSLNSSRSGLKATEPLGITLADIQNTEKKGKWWLVGASYQDTPTTTTKGSISRQQEDLDAQYDSDTPGSVNLSRLARANGMNTDVRRSIFITLLSSIDYKEANMRILKLHLKNKQMLEVPRVIVHCCGAEDAYNPYYPYVASTFCKDRPLRKAFAFNLWDFFRKFEDEDDDEDDDEGRGESVSIRKLVNLAKMFGHLVADRSLELGVLKKLDLTRLRSKANMFVNVLLTALFIHVRKTQKVRFEEVVREIFARAAGALEGNAMRGLRGFVKREVAKAELGVGKREKRAITMGCPVAVEGLDEAIGMGVVAEDEDEESD